MPAGGPLEPRMGRPAGSCRFRDALDDDGSPDRSLLERERALPLGIVRVRGQVRFTLDANHVHLVRRVLRAADLRGSLQTKTKDELTPVPCQERQRDLLELLERPLPSFVYVDELRDVDHRGETSFKKVAFTKASVKDWKRRLQLD